MKAYPKDLEYYVMNMLPEEFQTVVPVHIQPLWDPTYDTNTIPVCRVPKARHLLSVHGNPAYKSAGYHYRMPTASLAKPENILPAITLKIKVSSPKTQHS